MTIRQLYAEQYNFQLEILGEDPLGKIEEIPFATTLLVSEIGEFLQSDKRWKTHRNGKVDEANRIEELADMFIAMTNLVIFSGVTEYDLAEAIKNKQVENFRRWHEHDSNR